MSTTLNYGPIELRNVLSRFEQTPIRDASDTDIIYQQFDIHVSTLVYLTDFPAAQRSLGWTDDDIVSLAELEAAFRLGLERDRQRLIYSFSGVPVLDVFSSLDYTDDAPPPLGKTNDWGKVDVDNGPKVQDISITHVTPKTLRIQFSIRVCLGCDSSAGQIASNRWSSMDVLNEDFRTTRTWRGRLRLRAIDLFKEDGQPKDHQLTPHHFRDLVMPPLAYGFRRRMMEFMAEPNGLELAYTITDEEIIGTAAPPPATRVRGYHTEAAGPEAAMCVGDCQIQLWGPKTVQKGALISMAINLASNKLLMTRGLEGGKHEMRLTSITDLFEMDENSVVVNMRVLHHGIEDVQSWGSMVLKKMGQPLELSGEIDPDLAAVLQTKFSTAGIAQSLACYLQEPCGAHSMPSGKLLSENSPISPSHWNEDIGGTTITFQAVEALPHFEPPEYTPEHDAGMFVHYKVDVIYQTKRNRVALPIARGGSEESEDDDSVKLVDLARPTGKVKIRISGERTGDWPLMPKNEDFEASMIKYWVLDYKLNARPPRLTGDGSTRLYVMDLEACYQMSRAPKSSEKLFTANLPWDAASGPASGVPGTAFVDAQGFYVP